MMLSPSLVRCNKNKKAMVVVVAFFNVLQLKIKSQQ
jgi:hypothetical protein